MNVLIEENNFLLGSDCEELIRLFEENTDKVIEDNGAQILRVRYLHFSDFLKRVISKIYVRCKMVNPDVILDTVDIYKWPTGSSMPHHLDSGDELASVVYLNDDYEGGRTIVEGQEIVPETGKITIFSSSNMVHCVSETTGTRYTLAMWYLLEYKAKERLNEQKD
jgi:hypothetical protein